MLREDLVFRQTKTYCLNMAISSEKKSFLNLMILVHFFSHKTFFMGENSRPSKKNTSGMHACNAKLLLFDSWLIGVGTPSTPCQLLGGKATLHQEREKHEYLNLFFSLVAYDVCFHIDKNQIIQNFKKTWIHFMNLKLLCISTIYSRLPIIIWCEWMKMIHIP